MKRAWLPIGFLAIFATGCSSQISHTSAVKQGGVAPPAGSAPVQVTISDADESLAGSAPNSPTNEELLTKLSDPTQKGDDSAESAALPEPPSRLTNMDISYAASGSAPAPTPSVSSREESAADWDLLPAFPPEWELGTLPELDLQENEEEPFPELVSPGDEKLMEEIEKQGKLPPSPTEADDAKVTYDLPLETNTKVLDYIEIFQTSRRDGFGKGLARSKKYKKMMKDIFRELGLPTDLYFLALIESAFKPRAYSRARAVGIWQFISSTGRLYGLKRNHWIDERRDPEKSTRAAARHLKDLYEEFGSWPLSLAAYNAGEGRVKRAIAKAGTKDFWKLKLPAQTRNYVPAFYAALIIAKEPERYGFQLEYEAPLEVEEVQVEGGTRLSLVASFCRTSLNHIKELNPELRRSCAPPGDKYNLKIPLGRREQVMASLAKLPRQKITGWGSYRIKSGDTLSTIAARFGTSVEAIQEVNNLPSHFIRAGNRLMIPSVALRSIPRAPELGSAIPASGTYRVRRGDSLWSISRRFGVSLEKLMTQNNLSASNILQVGQILTLKKKREVKSAALNRPASGNGPTFYRVKKGDNLWQIARKFDTALKDLLRANGIRANQRIYPGDRLIIPTAGNL